MDAKKLNSELKELGYGFIKLNGGCNSYEMTRKAYKDANGKRYKGIYCGSYGPMTASNAHLEYAKDVKDNIIKTLSPFAIEVDLNTFSFKFDLGNKFRTLSFSKENFPTYSRDADLDPGYRSNYYIISSEDSKKPKVKKVKEKEERTISVQIIDMHNDIDPVSRNFNFFEVKDLDKSIDKFIIEELKLRRVTVNIDDIFDFLSDSEKDELEKLDYELV